MDLSLSKSNGSTKRTFLFQKPRTEFTKQEIAKRHSQGRFTVDELNSLTPDQRRATRAGRR